MSPYSTAPPCIVCCTKFPRRFRSFSSTAKSTPCFSLAGDISRISGPLRYLSAMRSKLEGLIFSSVPIVLQFRSEISRFGFGFDALRSRPGHGFFFRVSDPDAVARCGPAPDAGSRRTAPRAAPQSEDPEPTPKERAALWSAGSRLTSNTEIPHDPSSRYKSFPEPGG